LTGGVLSRRDLDIRLGWQSRKQCGLEPKGICCFPEAERHPYNEKKNDEKQKVCSTNSDQAELYKLCLA
jgi:hypothetical protein